MAEPLNSASAEKSEDHDSGVDGDGIYQGPHDWRKRLRPVESPIKNKSRESLDGVGLVTFNGA